MSLAGAVQLVGLGLLAKALFCPNDPEGHKTQEGWNYCPVCGSKLAKDGEKRS